ncbi:MAG TPA: hypothetical protein VMF03_07285 [Steroidobacteraceae bacterium]|nr:hypothetical protein [Steroidobacteraceae bacterium]
MNPLPAWSARRCCCSRLPGRALARPANEISRTPNRREPRGWPFDKPQRASAPHLSPGRNCRTRRRPAASALPVM